MPEPHDDLTFMIDPFAVLGVEREADTRTVKSAYQKLQKAYHPERFAGWGVAMIGRVTRQAARLREAFLVVSKKRAREEYARQLRAWDGPVSLDGEPVRREPSRFGFERLLNATLTEDLFAEFEGKCLRSSGHDPNTLQVLETLYRTAEAPGEEVLAAYRRALANRESYLAMLQELNWRLAGFLEEPIERRPGSRLEGWTMKRAHAARAEALEVIDETLIRLMAGTIELFGPDVRSPQSDDERRAYLLGLRQRALEQIDAAIGRIRSLAKQRADNAAKAVATVRGTYDPPGRPRRPKLLVIVTSDERQLWLSYRLEDGQVVNEDHAPSPEDAFADGYSVVRLALLPELDVTDQYRKIVDDHFEKPTTALAPS